jgi:hypothetical protein
MQVSNDRGMIRGLQLEDVAVHMGSEAGVQDRDLGQVNHDIVDTTEGTRATFAITNAGEPIVLCDREALEVAGEPLAQCIVMLVGVEVVQVYPAISGHASVHVSHKDGDVVGRGAGSHGPA